MPHICCEIRKDVFFIWLCFVPSCFLQLHCVLSLRIQRGADFLADWWQKCENVFWKQSILLCILFESQMMVLHFDVILVSYDDICHWMAEPLSEKWRLVLKPHTRQQFVTKMKNKSEKHKWTVLFHYSFFMALFWLFIVLRQIQKTYIIHWFDGQSMCLSNPSWLCEFLSQMLCCGDLLSSPHNSPPSSKVWILYYHQSVITAAVMVQKSAS